MQNYDEAQSLFEDILTKDPYRLEVGGVWAATGKVMQVLGQGAAGRYEVEDR